MTSTRLPGKVLMEAVGKPMLALMVERLRRVPALDGIIIATTTNPADDPVAALAARLGVGCHRGSEEDVMARVVEAARTHDVEVIVETTGDCPLIDSATVQRVIEAYLEGGVDYASNTLSPRTYAIGMDTQVFATEVLADAARRTDDPDDREHVSLYIYRHPEIYELRGVHAPPGLTAPELRLTLDTTEDLRLIRTIFERLYPSNPGFDLGDILALVRDQPHLSEVNRHV